MQVTSAIIQESRRANAKALLSFHEACVLTEAALAESALMESINQKLNDNDPGQIACPHCKAEWPSHRRDEDGLMFRVNYCRHCRTYLWQELPCGHETPISELPYNYCGECGTPTGLAVDPVPA